jgi:hypothetical protein
VGDFPDSAAELALIPKELEGALRELEVEEDRTSSLADEMAALVQEAVARDLWQRSKDIASDRGRGALIRKHLFPESASHNQLE